jgi:hypothetical protein
LSVNDESVWLHYELVISWPVRGERHIPRQESKLGLFDLIGQDIPSLVGTVGGTNCGTEEAIARKEVQGHHYFCAQNVLASPAALTVTGRVFPRDFLKQLSDHRHGNTRHGFHTDSFPTRLLQT